MAIISADEPRTQPAGVPVVAASHQGLERAVETIAADLLALLDDLRTQADPADVPIAESAAAAAAFLVEGLRTLALRRRARAITIRPQRPMGDPR